MSDQGTEVVQTHDGEWTIEWSDLAGTAYKSGDDRIVNICGDAIEIKGCVPRTVVEHLFARVEK